VTIESLPDAKTINVDAKTPNIFFLAVRGNVYVKRNTDTEQRLKKDTIKYLETLNPEDKEKFYKEFKDVLEKIDRK